MSVAKYCLAIKYGSHECLSLYVHSFLSSETALVTFNLTFNHTSIGVNAFLFKACIAK